VLGAGERLARVEHATLSVRRKSSPTARVLSYTGERNPALDPAERAAWERLVSALA
jgi:hypothetical protein